MIYGRLWLLTFLILHSSFFILSSCQDKRARDDQGKTSACWIYAMLECVEHEAAKRGDSVQLSRQWLMAKELAEQTERRYLVGDGKISLRGVGPEALRLINTYGLIPYQHEKTEITKSSVLERKLDLLASQAKSLEELREQMTDLLPQFTTTRPRDGRLPAFYYLSMRYNPLQFAESVMYYQHWHFFASVPYHPYGRPFVLEVADNYNHHEYMNLPMDSIVTRVIASLRRGHAVYWEYGEKTKDGGVSSNHAMAIVGMKEEVKEEVKGEVKRGVKEESNLKFVCKNSYGKQWGNKGYCLVSLEDFKNKTCNIGITDEGI